MKAYRNLGPGLKDALLKMVVAKKISLEQYSLTKSSGLKKVKKNLGSNAPFIKAIISKSRDYHHTCQLHRKMAFHFKEELNLDEKNLFIEYINEFKNKNKAYESKLAELISEIAQSELAN